MQQFLGFLMVWGGFFKNLAFIHCFLLKKKIKIPWLGFLPRYSEHFFHQVYPEYHTWPEAQLEYRYMKIG